ncbi:MAG: ABC transporter permease [Phycisphaerae bacterium]|nr:ABC transporter permease [Phycisphaerae bacterium]
MLWLAFKMLLGDTTKWLGVVLGVFLCTFLVTHLLSMFSGMMARSYALVSDIPIADVWVMDPAVEYADEPAGLPDTALSRVRSVDGVAWATPLFTRSLRARLISGAFRSVLVVGVDDATLVGAPSELAGGRLSDLRRADAVIVDEGSAATLLRVPLRPPAPGPGWRQPELRAVARALTPGDELLINDRRVVVVGLARLAARFLAKPVVYTTYSRAVSLAPVERGALSFVLVHAREGQDPAELAARIERVTGLKSRTRGAFSDETYGYYVRMTGVVDRIVFMIGIGIVVGVSVSALLLYLFTSENLPLYATLNALGMTHGTLVRMVIVQAMIAGVTGYGLGVGASALFATLLHVSAMPFRPTTWNLGLTAVTVVGVAGFSSALSAARLARLEPGLAFRR